MGASASVPLPVAAALVRPFAPPAAAGVTEGSCYQATSVLLPGRPSPLHAASLCKGNKKISNKTDCQSWTRKTMVAPKIRQRK
uniref:Uncharacterized protein n=1 Tax=Oryza glaberrima TaxID=4538 RepID=I1P8R6_ORYGL